MEKVRKLTSAAGLVVGLFGLASLSGPALAADCPINRGPRPAFGTRFRDWW
jgi:hypothetical protein